VAFLEIEERFANIPDLEMFMYVKTIFQIDKGSQYLFTYRSRAKLEKVVLPCQAPCLDVVYTFMSVIYGLV
jgi:hypothetical protein